MIQSRRDFLKNAGKLAVAASVVSVIPMSAMAEAHANETHPYAYTKLDLDTTANLAYESFSAMGGCCIGVANALIGQLHPEFPVQMFANGAAGYTANSLCGCIGGAAAAFGLYCNAADSKALLKELMTWYKTSTLPAFERDDKVLAQVVPGSVNCVDSVGKFFQATGITDMGNPDRIHRCALLTADVAKKAAELLNAHFGV